MPFISGKPIHYSAAAESGVHLRNYYVTYVTQAKGSVLFVNVGTNSEHLDDETGLPTRVVKLDAQFCAGGVYPVRHHAHGLDMAVVRHGKLCEG